MKQWMDRVTGRFTMYRVVLLALIAIAVVAIGLSVAGQLLEPVALLASALVAVTVTMVTSWLFALLFRTKAHLESAAITGLLVFFVLVPSSSFDGLWPIALAALIASASKYLLAIRGKHIFNPAAIGALVVTAFGFTFSGWWIATPFLLPIVAIGAFVVLYRTRRLEMGAVFVVVAAGVMIMRLGTIDAGLNYALLSYPVIFVAGFMLSEPLTLPPRRWQQLSLAILVALLMTIPFNIGPLYSSPQLALVIGNLVAFFFGQRRGIRLTLESKKQLTPTTWEFTFRPARPVSFTPGQYMELTVPHRKADAKGTRRMFSISSAPGETVTFALRVTSEVSTFKTALLALEPGAAVRGTLVAGDFILPKSLGTPVLLVAGGIGITPFASQLADSGRDRNVVVVYAVSSPDELAYASLLQESGARVIVTAATEPASLPAGWIYGGTRIAPDMLMKYVSDLPSRHAYVSGPPSLVNDVRVMLRTLGSKNVSTDYFSGY